MLKDFYVSVIVPVYNVEPYLDKCINSVLNQTFQNYELILVDDGSTDNSGKICEEYSQKDRRIKVIHQKNAGLSVARNNGFELSKGNYICFLDSDDWYSENALEVMVDIVKNYDVEIGMIKLFETTTENIKYESKDGVKIVSSYECIGNLLKDHNNYVQACNKLYKRELLEKLKFPEGKIYEDFYIVIDRYQQIKQLGYSEKACMFYRIRNASISHSSFSIKSLHYIDALEHVIGRLFEIDRKDVLFYFANKLLNSYMEYSLKLSNSDITDNDYYINKYRINSKKLFKSIPFYKWKLHLIKRFLIFIFSFKLYKFYMKFKGER